MLISRLHNTLRGRIVLLAVGVELIMLLLLVANSSRLLYNAMTEQARWQAKQIAPVLSAALAAPLAQRDYATVQAVIAESHNADGLTYISVIDQTGNSIAKVGWDHPNTIQTITNTVFSFHNGERPHYDVLDPLQLHGQQLGTLRFGISLTKVFTARHNLLTQSAAIALVELVLSSLVLLLIGLWLTRHLKRLTEVSLEVASGNLTLKSLPEGQDDIGRLGAAFNTMSQAISERVQELDHQKALLKATIDSTTDLIFYKDLHGIYLGCNPAFATFVGKPQAQIIGASDFDIFPQAIANLFREQDRAVIELNSSRSNEEWVTYPNEQRVLLDTNKSPLRDLNGQMIGLIGISRDITHRSQMEQALHEQTILLEEEVAERQKAQEALLVRAQELEELNRTLEDRVQEELHRNREKDIILLQQDKLASIGQLAAGVAHEINNPIGFIMSNLETLKGYLEPLQQYISFTESLCRQHSSYDEERLLQEVANRLDIPFILQDLQPLITESSEGAERVKRIVFDLKDFARPDENSPKEADLNHLVQSTVNIVRNELKYVAQLELQMNELPPLVCIPQQINQVITNLLVNAAHAITHHGSITVRTWHEEEHALLTIADTGHGIPDDVLNKIFDPFFTTKTVGKGTGLGLTISYDIVRKHGGEITVTSSPGVGTTFTIKLPLSGPGSEAVQ
jgi:two-component system, NtrC family, sensor kinase